MCTLLRYVSLYVNLPYQSGGYLARSKGDVGGRGGEGMSEIPGLRFSSQNPR